MFKKEYVLLNIDLKTKEEAMAFIAAKAYGLGISSDINKTEEDLWNREKEFNTAIDSMIAIPHTKSDSINYPAVMIIKFKKTIDWGEENIGFIISFLSPSNNKDNVHLTMLSKISRKLIDDEFKSTLCTSDDVDSIYKMIMEALCS